MRGARHVVRALVLAALAAAAVVASAGPAEAGAGCGRGCIHVTVPLDRSGAVPGTVRLTVHRERATHRPKEGVTFELSGEAGQPEGDLGNEVASAFGQRDVVTIDRRGTGGSQPLRCRRLESARTFGGAAVRECAKTLGARRDFYTPEDDAADLEAVRARLGYPRIALSGARYGAAVALTYARRHPDRVERMVLDSPVDPDGEDALQRPLLASLTRALPALCGLRCAEATPDPVRDLIRLRSHLGRRLDRGEVLRLLGAATSDPFFRSSVPGALHAAAGGDPAAALRLVRETEYSELDDGSGDDADIARALATGCSTDRFPWAPGAGTAQRLDQARAVAAATPVAEFGPLDRQTALAGELLNACARWPAPARPSAVASGYPRVPTLVLAGTADLRAPVARARAIASEIPGARVLVVPRATGPVQSESYGGVEGCPTDAGAAFLLGHVPPARCKAPYPFSTAPAPPRSLRGLSPAPGTRGMSGRVLRAVLLTARDAFADAPLNLTPAVRGTGTARARGIHGGAYFYDFKHLLTFRRDEWIAGVAVTGTLRDLAHGVTGRLRIAGRHTPDGTIRLSRGRFRARFGRAVTRGRLSIVFPPPGD